MYGYCFKNSSSVGWGHAAAVVVTTYLLPSFCGDSGQCYCVKLLFHFSSVVVER